MVKYLINYVFENCPDELNFFNSFVDKDLIERLKFVAESPFIRMSYTDAVKELEKVNDRFTFKAYWGCDLQTEHERYLTEELCKCPVFVTDYPKEILTARIRELGLNEEDYSWYLDLRKYGGARHGGFGLGFERLIMYLTGISNIRDVLLFPRTVGNAEF